MGHIFLQNQDEVLAIKAWVTVYLLAKQSNLAKPLQDLNNLANNAGLEGGLQAWERFAQQLDAASNDQQPATDN